MAVAEEFVVVVAGAETTQGEKVVFLAGGKLVASKLFAVPPHITAELAVDVRVVAGVVRNLDIAVPVQE